MVEFVLKESLMLRRNMSYEQGLDSVFVKKTEGSMRRGDESADELVY